MDIYKAARERIAADFDKRVLATPKPSDTAKLRESRKKEWQRKARTNYVAKNRDKIRALAREYYRSKHPGCKIRGEYKHKKAA